MNLHQELGFLFLNLISTMVSALEAFLRESKDVVEHVILFQLIN